LSRGKTSCTDYSKTRCGLDSAGEHALFSAPNTSAAKIGAMAQSPSARDAHVRASVSFFP
jgi:hypothetical protein